MDYKEHQARYQKKIEAVREDFRQDMEKKVAGMTDKIEGDFAKDFVRDKFLQATRKVINGWMRQWAEELSRIIGRDVSVEEVQIWMYGIGVGIDIDEGGGHASIFEVDPDTPQNF